MDAVNSRLLVVLAVLNAGGVMINANRFYLHGVRTNLELSTVPF